jgi:hypothetical protein
MGKECPGTRLYFLAGSRKLVIDTSPLKPITVYGVYSTEGDGVECDMLKGTKCLLLGDGVALGRCLHIPPRRK